MPARVNIELLLIEDNSADAKLFQSAMSQGFDVRVVSSGAEALDYLFRRGRFGKVRRPDLIVLDLNLPILTGHEVLNAAKSNSELSRIPVVVYSGSENPADIRRAYELGASAYLVKPSSLDELRSVVRTLGEFWSNVHYPSGESSTHALV
jgi:CheY-like chemotaxis protein